MFVHLFTGVFGQSMWALKLTQLVPFLSSLAGIHPAVNSFLNWNLGTLIVTLRRLDDSDLRLRGHQDLARIQLQTRMRVLVPRFRSLGRHGTQLEPHEDLRDP